jgi:exoribonuclease R
VLLKQVGEQRMALERRRGGMSLRVPDQEVARDGDSWTLRYRKPVACEDWNAQLSLLTGMAAARIMLDGGVGILRTMPDADRRDVERLRLVARGLGIDWHDDESYGALLARLDGSTPQQAALLDEASVLFRGAAYTLVDKKGHGDIKHAAVAAPYAHVTAPLRRLVDRYATEACLALAAGERVPAWVVDGLPALPALMEAADRRQGALERAIVELMEAVVLEGAVGSVFEGVVVDVNEKSVNEKGGGTVMLREPAVMARCDGDLEFGKSIRVRVAEADPAQRTVRFSKVE